MWFSETETFFLSFFLTKKFIERFGEGFSLGVWPNPHERALQRSTSRVVHQTLRVWNQWYYCQYLLEISNGTCSFYALSFCAIYKDTWKNQERGSIAFLFSEKQKQEEKGVTEDEMVAWHHWLNGHEFEWTPGVGWWTGRPGVLRFMGSQRVGHDWATELNWTENGGSPISPRKSQGLC